MSKFDQPLHLVFRSQFKTTLQQKEHFVVENLVEVQIAGVVLVQLQLALHVFRVTDHLIEQFYEHGGVIGERGRQLLSFADFIIPEHLRLVLVQEVVVVLGEDLETDHIWRSFITLQQNELYLKLAKNLGGKL